VKVDTEVTGCEDVNWIQLAQDRIQQRSLENNGNLDSSLNVFDDVAVLLRSVFWTLSIALVFFKQQRFKGWFFPRHQVKPTLLGPVDRAILYRWTREKPSLETLWFKKHMNDA
jgi:hypothetical protein